MGPTLTCCNRHHRNPVRIGQHLLDDRNEPRRVEIAVLHEQSAATRHVAKANAIQDAMPLLPLKADAANSNSNPNSNSKETQCPVEVETSPEAVEKMSGVEFFSKLSEVMAEQGALLLGDGPMLRTLAGMGVRPLATVSVDTSPVCEGPKAGTSFALVHSAAQGFPVTELQQAVRIRTG